MTPAAYISGLILIPYICIDFATWRRAKVLRGKPETKGALPQPLSFIGPAIWAYTFSGRHVEVGDQLFSTLIRVWRPFIVLLPIGLATFLFMSG